MIRKSENCRHANLSGTSRVDVRNRKLLTESFRWINKVRTVYVTRDNRLISERFPRASSYHPEWVLAGVSGGANPLWLTEWLGEAMNLQRGMKVLDLGCGRALSSVFLHHEFGVQVWATDLWFSASENIQRVRDAGAEGGVFPIRADARSLPFSDEFFDAIVSIDSFMFFGTDDLYLNYLARFVKPRGPIGIALAGVVVGLIPTALMVLGRAWSWLVSCAERERVAASGVALPPSPMSVLASSHTSGMEVKTWVLGPYVVGKVD